MPQIYNVGGKMTDLKTILPMQEREIRQLIAKTEESLAKAPEGTLLIYKNQGNDYSPFLYILNPEQNASCLSRQEVFCKSY